jgi:hypothetical protein
MPSTATELWKSTWPICWTVFVNCLPSVRPKAVKHNRTLCLLSLTHYTHRALNLTSQIPLGKWMGKHILKEGSYLGSLWSSTKYASVPYICRGAKILGNTLNLLSQLSCGGKDQSNGAFTTSQSFLIVNVNCSRKNILQIQPPQYKTQIRKKKSECCFCLTFMLLQTLKDFIISNR